MQNRTNIHECNFVCTETGDYTLHVISFNYNLMLKIKEMKGLMMLGVICLSILFVFIDYFYDDAFNKKIEILVFDFNSIEVSVYFTILH